MHQMQDKTQQDIKQTNKQTKRIIMTRALLLGGYTEREKEIERHRRMCDTFEIVCGRTK